MRWCRELLRAQAKSIYLATRFLPRRKREAVEGVYAIFRVADDLADEGDLTRDERIEGLAAVERAVRRIRDPEYDGAAPWFPAARLAFARFPISVDDAVRLIDACRSDVAGVRCESMDDLLSYAAGVAGTIGRFSMPILGAADQDSLDRAERLGIALQLTNVLRDVEKDRKIGRNYFPREFDDLPDRGASRIAAKAKEYYREAPILAKRLPNDGSRLALLVCADIYEGMASGPLSLKERLRRVSRCIIRTYR
jgi:phytoene synthase